MIETSTTINIDPFIILNDITTILIETKVNNISQYYGVDCECRFDDDSRIFVKDQYFTNGETVDFRIFNKRRRILEYCSLKINNDIRNFPLQYLEYSRVLQINRLKEEEIKRLYT